MRITPVRPLITVVKWIGFCLGFVSLLTSMIPSSDWGFFGHRLINEMAVYTLPPELQIVFKPEIQYIVEHAVDADKRRYAVLSEGFHHYIDLDHYGDFPFPELPRDRDSAVVKYSQIKLIKGVGDTLIIEDPDMKNREYSSLVRTYLIPSRYSGNVSIHCDTFENYLGSFQNHPCAEITLVDSLSLRGDLPYHLNKTYSVLTRAFMDRDVEKIIRISADLGHYIADAHVPLHTTSNYDGQLTGQQGIHAFWESRLPELFARTEFDFFVGKASYISDKSPFFWDIVLSSHSLVSEVLAAEARVRSNYPMAYQFCFEDRLNQTTRTPCKGYANAFHRELGGMVESQMRKAIKAVGDCWFSAWVDAGQPDLSSATSEKDLIEVSDSSDSQKRESVIRQRMKIRAHE